MFVTMQIDPKGQDMLAVDASNTPPIFNRPPCRLSALSRQKGTGSDLDCRMPGTDENRIS